MEAEMQRELQFHPEIKMEKRVATNNSLQQIAQIKELASMGVDLLIVAPNESEPLTQIIEEVYQGGTPVILIDRKTESDQYSAFVGADNFELGREAANYLVSQLGTQSKIIELQLGMSISPAIERSRGFREVISRYSGMEIVATQEINIGPDQINDQLPTILDTYPEATVIFAHTDLIAERAYQVAREEGKAGDFFFIGVDGIPGTGRGIQAVEEGILDASMLYPTGGVEAIRVAVAILDRIPYQKMNLLQTLVIDQRNAKILHQQMKKIDGLQEAIDVQIAKIDILNNIYRSQRFLIFVLFFSLLLAIVMGSFLWYSVQKMREAYRQLELKNEEVLKQKQQIEKISEQLQKSTKAKVDFFTSISHEFRTPLTLIQAFSDDLLPSSDLSEKNLEAIRLIKQNGTRLLNLVNQLMDFRKIENNKMVFRPSENHLLFFLRQIMKSFELTAQKRQIDFRLVSDADNLMLWFDLHLMDKVLFNLLSNAFKFTDDGGNILIKVSIDTLEEKVHITLEDSGRGMRPEEAARVFDAFYQTEEGRTKGTGLGLALTKALVELHQGYIQVSSILGKGSRFTIKLPLGKVHLDDKMLINQTSADFEPMQYAAEEYINPLEEAAERFAENRILIIEDNQQIQSFLQRKLAANFEILCALDGEKGLDIAFQETPNLIICDIMLPGKDGLEVTKKLKSDLRTSHIPIIQLTAQSTVEQEIEGTRSGADAYLTKPFNVNLLLEKIKNLLTSRELLKERYRDNQFFLQEQGNLSALDQHFIEQFMHYVQNNFHRQDFQMSDLSQELNLSRSQLYRKVKALLGQSIADIIQDFRLKKAEEFLISGELTISEIAYEVGYSTPDYFSRVFKGKHNVVPSQFRNHVLKSKKK